ncbi:MAG: aminotransferase [Acidiferrobacterales bacterium]|nr:aminotransferase [Acidiferrobacterales bacterium]
MLNPNVDALDTPAIPLAGSWAELYKGEHGPLIDLSQAVPNYPPHDNLLKELANASANPENCGYGDIEGEPRLRHAYSVYASQLYGAEINASQTHITSGCNQAFFATLLAVAQPGSTMLMPNPCYFNHKATAEILGMRIRYVEADPSAGFLPDLSAIKAAIDSSVSVVALVSPNNPTGAIYPTELLESIARHCAEKGVWLILDETYREFGDRGSPCPHRLFQQVNWSDYLIQLYSFSKTYCIPGHRLGAVIAGDNVIGGVTKVMDNMQICAPRPVQIALADQIPRLGDWVMANNIMIAQRAKAFTEVINQTQGWAIRSLGAYFAYVERPFLDVDSITFVRKLASELGVLPLPGQFFGETQDQYLRMAFANADLDAIELLPKRLDKLRF